MKKSQSILANKQCPICEKYFDYDLSEYDEICNSCVDKEVMMDECFGCGNLYSVHNMEWDSEQQVYLCYECC